MTLRTGLVLLFTAVLLVLAWLAREVLLLGFLGILVGVVFSFPVGWLSRAMPRGVAVILVLLALAGAIGGTIAVAAPTLAEQAGELRDNGPRAIRAARRWLDRHAQDGGELSGKAKDAIAKASEKAVPALLAIVSGATAAVLVIVLGAFLVLSPRTYRDGLRRLVPREREEVFDECWVRLGRELRHWVGGIVVAMTLMGTLAAVGLWIAGIHDWLLLGLLTFVGTFVPYVGAIASAIPGLLTALSQSPRHLVYALIVYLGVHLVEGYLVQPLIMRRAVEVKPATLLIGQGAMAAIFGVLGAVVATPLMVCIQVLAGYLWVDRRLDKAGDGDGEGLSPRPGDRPASPAPAPP